MIRKETNDSKHANIRALWESGLTLWEALFEFGEPETAKQYAAHLRSTPGIRAMDAIMEAIQAGKIEDAFKGASDTLKIGTQLQEKLERDLFDKLIKGDVVALGYAIPRAPDDPLRRIPTEAWNGKVDIHAGTASANGLEFTAIRVVHPEAREAATQDIRAPGRPSRQSQIVAAFKALDAAGQIDRSQSTRSHFPEIRAQVKQMYPEDADNEKGLGDKALYNIVGPLFESD